MLLRSIINRSLAAAADTNLSILKSCLRCLSTRLERVGVLEPQRDLDRQYDTGQLFLHKIFGYRGVVLFPWVAYLYDRDTPHANSTKSTETEEGKPTKDASVKGKSHNYYQVLIDARDCPHIRAQSEAVTFLGNQENKALFAIPGLDYVGHEDVLPYISGDTSPIQHQLFDSFLQHQPDHAPQFVAKQDLLDWQDKNHPWLELSDVHRETTGDIRVTVTPFYMGCRESPQSQVHWWRYSVRLENLGSESVRLRERHWRIFSLSGTLETVRGRGVIGQEPILSAEQPAFQYSSHVSLQASSGHMWGTYKMERKDGTSFDCKIPPFSLESKGNEKDLEY